MSKALPFLDKYAIKKALTARYYWLTAQDLRL